MNGICDLEMSTGYSDSYFAWSAGPALQEGTQSGEIGGLCKLGLQQEIDGTPRSAPDEEHLRKRLIT